MTDDGAAIGDGGDHFVRDNALVRNGWLHTEDGLKDLELRVWFIYQNHAKSDGSDARPSLNTVRRILGHKYDGHIRMARRRLEALGLLRRQDRKVGGRSGAAVSMLVPPADAAAIVAGSAAGASDRRGPSSIGPDRTGPSRTGPTSIGPDRTTQPGPVARALPGPNARAPSKEEQTHEQTHEQRPLTPGAAGAAGEGAAKPARKRRQRILTEEQQQTRIAFGDWWMSAAWPRFHEGATYGFEGDRDGPAVLRLLRHPKVKWDLERAKAIALYYLKLADAYLVHLGKPLPTLAARVNYYASKLDQLSQQGATHVIGISADGSAAGVDTYSVPAGRRAGLTRAGDGQARPGPAAAAAG